MVWDEVHAIMVWFVVSASSWTIAVAQAPRAQRGRDAGDPWKFCRLFE